MILFFVIGCAVESPSCVCTPIGWRDGMDLTKRSASFFSWFCSQDDASTDDIAEVTRVKDFIQTTWSMIGARYSILL